MDLFLQKNKLHETTWFFANIGLSPFLIHVVVRSGSLTSLSSFHSLSFYIIKGKTNTSSKKPKIPTTKTPSCLSLPLICLYYWQNNVICFVSPGKLSEYCQCEKNHPLLHNWLGKTESSNSWQVSHSILINYVGTLLTLKRA